MNNHEKANAILNVIRKGGSDIDVHNILYAIAIRNPLALIEACPGILDKLEIPDVQDFSHLEGKMVKVIFKSCGPNKIQAIKLIREATGLGLADAKMFVETPGRCIRRNVYYRDAMNLLKRFMLNASDSKVFLMETDDIMDCPLPGYNNDGRSF